MLAVLNRRKVTFPLTVHSSGRYLVDAAGAPFHIHGDSPWTLEVNCTRAQIRDYLGNRASRGFNSILFEAFEHAYSNQSPAYKNVEGENPFTTMTRFDLPNDAYWQLIDYIVAEAAAHGILCIITPAYYGNSSAEGWQNELGADTSPHLQAFGAFLATRYGGAGNILWVVGGDHPSGASLFADITTGMRSVRMDHLITGHSSRTNDAYSSFSTVPGFNVNTIYTNGTEFDFAATAYARSGPLPFFLIESGYEGDGSSQLQLRRQAYATVLAGGCGAVFGSDLWSFGMLQSTTAATAIANYINSTGTDRQRHVGDFFRSIPWHTLSPRTDTSLITTSKGTGASTICGAMSADSRLAVILTPAGAGFTIAMTQFAQASIVGRWFDPSNGSYTPASGSPYSNTGTHAFTTPGNNADGDSDWLLVLN